jgi:hypothetical protein
MTPDPALVAGPDALGPDAPPPPGTLAALEAALSARRAAACRMLAALCSAIEAPGPAGVVPPRVLAMARQARGVLAEVEAVEAAMAGMIGRVVEMEG